jgi:hypothetical protein
MYDSFNKRHIFDNIQLGADIEFFSPIERKNLATKLTKVVRRKVLFHESYMTKTEATDKVFKLYPNFYGGYKMNTVSTGYMPYYEGINSILSILNFVDQFGFTSEKCKMSINLKINEKQLTVNPIRNLNIFKFLLNIDEAAILEFWNKSNPEKIYKNTIKYIYPKNTLMCDINESSVRKISPSDFTYPKSKYFGLDINEIKNNTVKLRYVGGPNYHKKKDKIVQLIDSTIETMYETLANPVFSDLDRSRVFQVLKEQAHIVNSLKSFDKFKAHYPDIRIMIDLKEDDRLVKGLRYDEIKEKIFELLAYGNIKRGLINYDTDTKAFQIKETRIDQGFYINNVEFFDSIISGDLNNCSFNACEIAASKLNECTIMSYNNIKKAAIYDCAFHGTSNIVKTSYIKNKPDLLIEADIFNSVIREGTVAYGYEVDSLTEFIESKIKK